jgi:hypothetical protein
MAVSGVKAKAQQDQKIAAFGSFYRGNAYPLSELPKAAIF